MPTAAERSAKVTAAARSASVTRRRPFDEAAQRDELAKLARLALITEGKRLLGPDYDHGLDSDRDGLTDAVVAARRDRHDRAEDARLGQIGQLQDRLTALQGNDVATDDD